MGQDAVRGPVLRREFRLRRDSGLAALERRDRRDPHAPGAVGGGGDGARPVPAPSRADARPAGQLGLLRRGRRAAPNPRIGPAPPGHPGQHGVRGHLGRHRATMARAGGFRRPDGPDGQRRRFHAVPAGPQRGRGFAATPPARSSPAGFIPRRTSRSCSRPGPRSPGDRPRT